MTNSHTDTLAWWRDARFGMFIHWGLYAIPAGEWQGQRTKSLAEWIQCHLRIPNADYHSLAAQFDPVAFDADAIASLAAEAGMKYLVFTAKHHDGFAMYHSQVDRFNIVDATPYGRDPVAELAAACRKHGVVFCLYYSQDLDWAHPDGGGNDWDFPAEDKVFERYFSEKCLPQIRELLTNYGPIGLLWFDMAATITREQSERLRDVVHEMQPACLVSGRVGHGVGDYGSLGDNQMPLGTPAGDWETPGTLNSSWGFKHWDHNWRSPDEIIGSLADLANKGVNYLLNIGPDARGAVPQESVEILQAVGHWTQRNADAIYGSRANPYDCEFSWGRVTRSEDCLYLIFFTWPDGDFVLPGLLADVGDIAIVGAPTQQVAWRQYTVGETPQLLLSLPSPPPVSPYPVVRIRCHGAPQVLTEPCEQSDGSVLLQPHVADIHCHSAPTERPAQNFGGFLAAAEAAEANNEVSAGTRMGVGPSGVTENWYSADDYVTWYCHILTPGTYEVRLRTMARKYQPWQGGHAVSLACCDQSLTAAVEDHGRLRAPRNYHFEEAYTTLGQLAVDSPGRYLVSLRATRIDDRVAHGLCVSGIELLPART